MTTLTLRRAAIAATVAAVLAVAGCSSTNSASQAQGNRDNNTIHNRFSSVVPYPYESSDPTDPLELKNLARRLQYFNSKGSTGYVYLLAPNTSQVIGYYVISGKVSSTGSQMTSTQAVTNCASDHGGSCSAVDSIGDDGSYGPSEGGPDGVFFFTTAGTLIETVMPWVYSSQPIKLYASAPQLDAAAH
jgi:hypothetical protein